MTPDPDAITEPTTEATPHLLRRVGLFDATMIMMGGIVGAGIFINPYVVARQVHTPVLILAVWVAGGVVAMLGGFVDAELAARMPNVGGQYAYLRDAFHPVAGFLYGWVLLLVIQTGGMAAVTVTFARYFLELTAWPISGGTVTVLTIVLLTVVNCLGVRAGSRVQSILMLLKIGAIATLIVAGLFLIRSPYPVLYPVLDRPPSRSGYGDRRRDGPGALCLRWMADRELHWGGDQRPDPQPLPCIVTWRRRSDCSLPRRELCLRACAWPGRARGEHGSGVVRNADGERGHGCPPDRTGYRILNSGFSQPVSAHRAARLFRYGE